MTNCRDETVSISCYTDALGVSTSVFANHIYDANGQLIALYYTDAAGVTLDTSAGTVNAGECPVAQPDVEWMQLCDILADGTVIQFVCRTITSFNSDGSVIEPSQVATFEPDKVTPYVVAGTIGDCDTCGPEASLGLITDLTVLGSTPLVPVPLVWTLLGKFGDPHPDAATYGGDFTFIGDLAAPSTHPSGASAGLAITGWNVHAITSPTQPVSDSNNHYWILGNPASFPNLTFNGTPIVFP